MVCRTLCTKAAVLIMAAGVLGLSVGCVSKNAPATPDLAHYREALKASEHVTPMAPGSEVEAEALKTFHAFYSVYSVEQIKQGIRSLYADEAYFGDPFHTVEGVEGKEAYFVFIGESVETCTFTVDELHRAGIDYYARWTMYLTTKSAPDKPMEVLGMSHVRFNEAGKIVFQQDYWDTSAMFDNLPVVGFWTRLVKSRLNPERSGQSDAQ